MAISGLVWFALRSLFGQSFVWSGWQSLVWFGLVLFGWFIIGFVFLVLLGLVLFGLVLEALVQNSAVCCRHGGRLDQWQPAPVLFLCTVLQAGLALAAAAASNALVGSHSLVHYREEHPSEVLARAGRHHRSRAAPRCSHHMQQPLRHQTSIATARHDSGNKYNKNIFFKFAYFAV